jgi:FAD-dependent oxidoreductase domain-containing protein 1
LKTFSAFRGHHAVLQRDMTEYFDVVIAGGAVMGSSTAFHLAHLSDGRLKILVAEPDPTYQRSASALSAGSIRQQFSQPVNIDISLHGINFLRNIGEHLAVDGGVVDVGLKEGGYLYVATAEGAGLLQEINGLQNSRGADIVFYDRAALSRAFPWLASDDLTAGSWGRTGEGWFDGYGLCQAFRKKAQSQGVTYRAAKVVDVVREGGQIAAALLDDGSEIACGAFINTAGVSGARRLAERMGFPIPVYAKKRCVFPFSCQTALPAFPLLIDTSGVWARPEGSDFIAGFSPDDLDEADHGADFDVDWALFDDVIWPALAARVPAFEAIRPGRAWAGHYDMCLLDHNALVGSVPGLTNGYMAAGFSGHGLQQSPAVGRGLAELVVHGGYRSLDLSPLGCERLLANRPLLERNVI